MDYRRIITVAGKRYRLTWKIWCHRVEVDGPRIIPFYLPEGVTLELPNADLREHVQGGLAAYRERHRAASEMIQQRVREGRF